MLNTTTELLYSVSASIARLRGGCCPLLCKPAEGFHQNRLLQLAREGAATTIQHLARFDDERRYGSLVAVLLETTATLTDERLARPEDFDFLGLITDGYSQLRRYAPTLLETFDFRAAPVVTPLMDAMETLRVVNRDKVRTIPEEATALMRQAYALLPHIKITDLLLA